MSKEQSGMTSVGELIERGILQVEDGNHGEYRPRRDEFTPEGVAFIRCADLTPAGVDFIGAEKINAIAYARIRKGIGAPYDVLLSHKGTVGKVAIAPADAPPYVCSPQTTFWRSLDHKVIHPHYLYLALMSEPFQRQLMALRGETDMAPYVSLTEQRKLWLRLVELGRQHAIAEVIGVLDDQIATHDRIIGTSSELISELYARAVAHSGPTAVPLASVVALDCGLPFASDSFNADHLGIPLLRIRDLKTFVPQVWTTQRLPNAIVVQTGDVVAGMDAEFKPYFWLGKPALLNQRVLRAKGRIPGTGSAFAREVLTQPLSEIERYKTGTTVIHLNRRDLDSCKVNIPLDEDLHAFSQAAEPLRDMIISSSQEVTILSSLRDTLLPRLMSGEIRVRDAERIVEDAT